MTGIEFDDCWRNRATIVIGGVELPFIDKPHLKQNKLALGRHRDLADLEELEELEGSG